MSLLYCTGTKKFWKDMFLLAMQSKFDVSYSVSAGEGSSISFLRRTIVRLKDGLMIAPGTSVDMDVIFVVKELAAFMSRPLLCSLQRLRKFVGHSKYEGDIAGKLALPSLGSGKIKQGCEHERMLRCYLHSKMLGIPCGTARGTVAVYRQQRCASVGQPKRRWKSAALIWPWIQDLVVQAGTDCSGAYPMELQ